MMIDTRHARLPLTVGQIARLEHARDSRLTALRGHAWITVDNDPRDIVLAPGESFVVDSNAGVLVVPLRGDQVLELAIDGPAGRPAPGRATTTPWARLRAALIPTGAASLTVGAAGA